MPSLSLLSNVLLVGAMGTALVAQSAASVAPIELQRFSAAVDQFGKAGRFSGVALVAQGDKVLFSRAYGLAEVAHSEPNQADTKFNLASVGKLFTAISILQMAQAGRLSLDARVGQYLPDYPNPSVRESVTIRQLLNHTSGLGDYFTEEFERASKDRFRNPKDFLPLFADKPLLFKPGSDMRYSNAGFLVLGLIVERLSGTSYFDYVARHIFQPAEMAEATYEEADYPSAHVATGYIPANERPGQWQSNVFQDVVKGGPAGGCYATAGDLLRFVRALVGGKLLNAEYTSIALTPMKDQMSSSYGVIRIKEHTIYGHSGGCPGVGADLNHCLETGLTVILFSNQDRTSWTLLDAEAQRLMVGELPPHADLEFTQKVVDLAATQGYAPSLTFLRAHPERQLVESFLKDILDELHWEGRDQLATIVKRLMEDAKEPSK